MQIESPVRSRPEMAIRERWDTGISSVASEAHPMEDHGGVIEGKAGWVCDGIGGHAGGREAAQIASDVCNWGLSQIPEGLDEASAAQAIGGILDYANRAVMRRASETGQNDMGTTAVLYYVCRGGKVIVASIGDSRAYLSRSGQLTQLTIDDNEAFARAGSEQAARALQTRFNNTTNPAQLMSPEEQAYFQSRNVITQALGRPDIRPRMWVANFNTETDTIALFSDGITDNLTDEELRIGLNSSQDASQAANYVMNMAWARSRQGAFRSKPDDMFALVTRKQRARHMPGGSGSARPRASRPATSFLKGSSIKAPIMDGRFIENGWKISDYDPTTRMVSIYKRGRGLPYSQQLISEQALIALNGPILPTDIRNANSIHELRMVLNNIQGLGGTLGFYSRETLQEVVAGVIRGEYDPNQLTRTCGLRGKLKRWYKKRRDYHG